MEIYIKIFEVIFPVFFVIGVGYYLGKKNPKFDTNFITNFAGNIGTPILPVFGRINGGSSLIISLVFKRYNMIVPIIINPKIAIA